MGHYVVQSINEVTNKSKPNSTYFEVRLEQYGDISNHVYLKLTEKEIEDRNIKLNKSIML